MPGAGRAAAPLRSSAAEASAEKAFAAERGIAGIRAAIITLNSVVYVLLMDKAGTVPWLAYAIVVSAHVYGYGVVLLKPWRRFPVMTSSYWTTGLDAVFITVWLLATGGVHSPFHLLWLASVTAVAFRFGFRETLTAAVLYAACYVGLLAALGQVRGHEVDVVVRVSYVFFVAGIGGLLARESQSQTREKVEMRRLAVALRESEERFRRLSDAAFEGIAIHDQGRIVECNAAFARMFGWSPEEARGLSAFDLIAPASHGLIRDRLSAPTDAPYEARARRRDGTEFDAEIVGRDFPYQGRLLRVVALRDVTERKRAEAAVAEQRALQEKNTRLQELDRLRTQFINNAAHELATPLTPIKLQSHLLSVGSLGPLNEKQQKAMGVVRRNVEQLGVLVRDVLDSARLQAGRISLQPEPVDLARVLREAVESFQETARQEGVRLSLETPAPAFVRGDPQRLTQVLFNLLSNALKFTPDGGEVRVRAAAADGHVAVEVRDTGAGLRPEDLPRLFQPFSQVHEGVARVRGSGLGLYISRGIVEAHGGRVWAASEGPGRGSTFGFAVPLADAARA